VPHCVARARHRAPQRRQGSSIVNRIIWLVGAVVIVLFILGYLGLR
jgi:small-conductance mechanosensitive channel